MNIVAMTPQVATSRGDRLLISVAQELASAWRAAGYPLSVPALPSLKVNGRLTRSLGRYSGDLSVIELRADVARWPARRLRPLLIHELAHAAVLQRHGTSVRPHGREWQSLMKCAGVQVAAQAMAGCRPWVKSGGRSVPARPSSASLAVSSQYEHRCPVCHMVRLAKRPVPRWRCRDCVNAGLEGRLIIRVLRKAR